MFRDRKQQRLVAAHMVEHAGEERWIGCRLANHLRADPCGGKKGTEPLGVPGHEAERLNRQVFSDFAGHPGRFTHAVCLSVTDRS